MFPSKEWLPPNLHLEVFDMLGGDLPKIMVGAFDVVHLRAFACVIKDGDPHAVLRKLCGMLSKWFHALSTLFHFPSFLHNQQRCSRLKSLMSFMR